MVWGEACSLVPSKSHYILFDSHIYITCEGSCTADKTTEEIDTEAELTSFRRENT